MKNTKYMGSGGLAFTEQGDMRRLSKYARRGWLLESFAPFGYKLRKSEPQNIVYSVDFHMNVDEEYYSIFESAGWTYVCSAGNGFHIFRAEAGTAPIYSDKGTLIDKYEREKKVMGKAALPVLIALIIFIVARVLSLNGWLPEIVGIFSLCLGIGSLFILIFPGMPYIAYRFKLNKLKK